MIRVTWLQFRTQALTALAAMAAFAVLLAATGPHLASLSAAAGLGSCHGGSCQSLAQNFLVQITSNGPYPTLYLISVGVILLAPAVIGLFWGAPLIARELETGTSDLAWNQSVTRTRWLAVKLTIGGLTAIAVTEALCLMQSWWAAPIGRAVGYGAFGALAQSRFSQLVFDTHGITPLGYAAFAFILGIAAGALIRRTIPAMAVTLAVFAALQVAVPLWVRPNLAPADHMVIPVTSVNNGPMTGPGGSTFNLTTQGVPGQPFAWLLSSGPVNAAGQPVSNTPAACIAVSTESDPSAFPDCLASHGIREAVTYQPASRYWPFQWTETAIYLALALALTGYCFRRLNHRLS